MTSSRVRTSLPEGSSAGARRCSVLGTLTVLGDFWTLGVLRCIAFGMRRFREFEEELGIATNVLTDRLGRLVDAGILERHRYQDRPPRHEYVLTEAGRDLSPIIFALKGWGDRHLQPDGPWTEIHHRGCSSPIAVEMRCAGCASTPGFDDLESVWLRARPEEAAGAPR